MFKTVISDPMTYNVNNMFFEKAKEQNVKISGTNVNFHRVNIKTHNPDGKTMGDLVLRLDRSLCLGLSDKFGSDKLSALILLWDNQLGPTPRQRKTEECLNAIIEKCREWFNDVENRKSVRKPSTKPETLFEKGLARRKEDENGNINLSDAPLFTVRLLQTGDRTDKNNNFVPAKINTIMYSEDERDENGNNLDIDPLTLINKRFYITAAIKVEDIFVGGKEITIQCKLVEAVIKPYDDGPKRLLADLFTADNNDDSNLYDEDVSSSFTELTTEETKTKDVEPEELQASDNEEEQEERPPTPPTKGKGKRGGKN